MPDTERTLIMIEAATNISHHKPVVECNSHTRKMNIWSFVLLIFDNFKIIFFHSSHPYLR